MASEGEEQSNSFTSFGSRHTGSQDRSKSAPSHYSDGELSKSDGEELEPTSTATDRPVSPAPANIRGSRSSITLGSGGSLIGKKGGKRGPGGNQKVDLTPIVTETSVQGYLLKYSDGKWNKSWHPRYFILDKERGVLSYYKEETSEGPGNTSARRKPTGWHSMKHGMGMGKNQNNLRGSVDFNHSDACLFVDHGPGAPTKWCFQVRESRGNQMKLCTESEEDQKTWTSAILEAIHRKFQDEGYRRFPDEEGDQIMGASTYGTVTEGDASGPGSDDSDFDDDGIHAYHSAEEVERGRAVSYGAVKKKRNSFKGPMTNSFSGDTSSALLREGAPPMLGSSAMSAPNSPVNSPPSGPGSVNRAGGRRKVPMAATDRSMSPPPGPHLELLDPIPPNSGSVSSPPSPTAEDGPTRGQEFPIQSLSVPDASTSAPSTGATTTTAPPRPSKTSPQTELHPDATQVTKFVEVTRIKRQEAITHWSRGQAWVTIFLITLVLISLRFCELWAFCAGVVGVNFTILAMFIHHGNDFLAALVAPNQRTYIRKTIAAPDKRTNAAAAATKIAVTKPPTKTKTRDQPPSATGGSSPPRTTTTSTSGSASPAQHNTGDTAQTVVAPSKAAADENKFPAGASGFNEFTAEDGVKPTSHTWQNVSAGTFRTRIGPDYKKNKKKAPSGPAICNVVKVDMWATKQKLKHIMQHTSIPPGMIPPGGFLVVINCMIPNYGVPTFGKAATDGPGNSMVMWCVIDKETMEESKTSMQGHHLLLRRLLNAGGSLNPTAIYERFKMIGRLANVEEVSLGTIQKTLITRYNATPILTRPQHEFYHGEDYLEVDIDVHKFSRVARDGLMRFGGMLQTLVIDWSFVIEGHDDSELPEVILGCARLNKPNREAAAQWPGPYE